MSYLFSSESVTNGHPDKICDQISDGILDEILKQDPHSHVAIETTVVMDKVHIMGEVTTTAHVDYEQIARAIIHKIGYTDKNAVFNAFTCKVDVDVHKQSPDINRGVSKRNSLDNGAGDQGMMFGFACDETEDYMPLAISLAHDLTKRLQFVRENNILPYLKPDGKAQVTLSYDDDGNVNFIHTIVVSNCHDENISIETVRKDIYKQVILPVIPEKLMTKDTLVFINPTGRFVVGGPEADSGLTGRKIIVDTYGGYARHGGGAFSGKDPSKVDRTGAYVARYIAKNIVAKGYAKKCEVQIAYAIGLADPVSLLIDTFNTETIDSWLLNKKVKKAIDLRPQAIIDRFDLCKPIYLDVASYGHFGTNAKFKPWEQLDLFK